MTHPLPTRFARAWHAVAETRSLQRGRLTPIRAFGEDLVAFRDHTGRAHVLGGRCPHLGARLADGRLEDDRVRCPLHGWEFGRDGRCARIPYVQRPAPASARVPAYPVVERAGLLWAWWGSERPAYAMPELDAWEPAGRWWSRKVWDFPNLTPLQVLENVADPHHFREVHHVPYESAGLESAEEERHELRFASRHRVRIAGRLLESRVRVRCIGGTVVFGTWQLGSRARYRFVSAATPVEPDRCRFFNGLVMDRGPLWKRPAAMAEFAIHRWLFHRGVSDDWRVWQAIDPRYERVVLPEDAPLHRFRRFHARQLEPTPRRASGWTQRAIPEGGAGSAVRVGGAVEAGRADARVRGRGFE